VPVENRQVTNSVKKPLSPISIHNFTQPVHQAVCSSL
jgi:hypothetical protein